MSMSLFAPRSVLYRAFALILPFLMGCEGSQLVNIDLPDAVVAGETFQVSVDHTFNDAFEPFSTTNGSLVFAAFVPDEWTATQAEYSGTAGGNPITVPVTISSAPPETSPEILDAFNQLIIDQIGSNTCDASVTLRTGPTLGDELIATLLAVSSQADFLPRNAGPVDLTAYAGSSVFVVSTVGSCLAPNGLLVDNLVLSTGGGNLLDNPSFEADFDGWNTSDSTAGCVNETLGAGDSTAGAGGWTVPAPSDGVLLYASDADDPGQCYLVQEVALDDGVTSATFTGNVGANIEVPFQLFLDVSPPVPPSGASMVWFRTDDIAEFGDFVAGDSGTLTVEFAAGEGSGGAQEIVFFHGYYSEVPAAETPDVLALASATPLRRLASAAGAAAAPVVQPSATPGFSGAGFWFTIDSGGLPQAQSISGSTLGFPDGTLAVPAMSGFMLLILSAGIGLLGLSRRGRMGK